MAEASTAVETTEAVERRVETTSQVAPTVNLEGEFPETREKMSVFVKQLQKQWYIQNIQHHTLH